MRTIFDKKCLLSLLSMLVGVSLYSQEYYVGVSAGAHIGSLKYSNLNEDYFPDLSSMGSPVLSIFGQIEYGENQNFAIRPQFSFLKRGGQVSGPSKKIQLERNYYVDDVLYGKRVVKSMDYDLSASYFDVRIPLIYQFLKKDSKVRPYLYVAPVLGLTTGGSIDITTRFNDDLGTEKVKTDVSKSNMSAFDFAAQVGAGFKRAIPLGDNVLYVGLEMSYELGITDTYSKDEKIEGRKSTSKPLNIYNNNKGYDISGTRKMNGFEIQAFVSVPLSVFKKKAKPVVEEVYVPAPVVTKDTVVVVPVVEEKPCYSMEEIQQMIDDNKSVRGKVICAINDAIQFDYNKSDIKKVSYEYLDNLAKLLIGVNAKVSVCGHTDNVGSAEYNKKLSQKRAESVMNYLIKQGVNKSLLTAVGCGMEEPIASNETEEGRAINRRVEFEIEN